MKTQTHACKGTNTYTHSHKHMSITRHSFSSVHSPHTAQMHRCEWIWEYFSQVLRCINTDADGLVTFRNRHTHSHKHPQRHTHRHSHTADNRNREGQETEHKLFSSSMIHPFDISPWKKCLSNHSFGWPTSELQINFLWGSLAHPCTPLYVSSFQRWLENMESLKGRDRIEAEGGWQIGRGWWWWGGLIERNKNRTGLFFFLWTYVLYSVF